MKSLTSEQLKNMIDNGNRLTLIDVREPREFAFCRIEGSMNIPMSQIDASLDKLDHDAYIVVICHHGVRSQQAAGYLEARGYKNISNLEGGIDDWARRVAPAMARY